MQLKINYQSLLGIYHLMGGEFSNDQLGGKKTKKNILTKKQTYSTFNLRYSQPCLVFGVRRFLLTLSKSTFSFLLM